MTKGGGVMAIHGCCDDQDCPYCHGSGIVELTPGKERTGGADCGLECGERTSAPKSRRARIVDLLRGPRIGDDGRIIGGVYHGMTLAECSRTARRTGVRVGSNSGRDVMSRLRTSSPVAVPMASRRANKARRPRRTYTRRAPRARRGLRACGIRLRAGRRRVREERSRFTPSPPVDTLAPVRNPIKDGLSRPAHPVAEFDRPPAYGRRRRDDRHGGMSSRAAGRRPARRAARPCGRGPAA